MEIIETKSTKTKQPIISDSDKTWLEAVENLVQKELADSSFNTSALAEKLMIDRTQLFRKLKKLTGLSPSQYIQEARLKKAFELFDNQIYDSVKAVGLSVGYSNRSSFAAQFKTRFGKLPSDML
ncbi:MAG: helix-turn-helix domain-containing protein [Saprospiraceae bacterium]|nr:helix-turn-helix domain-containing protein [Saprospiraceae bacterium]